jgi:hypothetical protein
VPTELIGSVPGMGENGGGIRMFLDATLIMVVGIGDFSDIKSGLNVIIH